MKVKHYCIASALVVCGLVGYMDYSLAEGEPKVAITASHEAGDAELAVQGFLMRIATHRYADAYQLVAKDVKWIDHTDLPSFIRAMQDSVLDDVSQFEIAGLGEDLATEGGEYRHRVFVICYNVDLAAHGKFDVLVTFDMRYNDPGWSIVNVRIVDEVPHGN